MPKKRKTKAAVLSDEDVANDLLVNPAFRRVIEQAYSNYVDTGGNLEAVNIAVTIISDGVSPPTQAIAADSFNLRHPKD